MRDWQAIGILVLCATVWLEYVVERMGRVILSRVDEAHEKLDALQQRLEEIEAKQDESTSTYVNPIDL
jgi:tRNA(Phe) wybutosine-synthesizing methylase Tyw3